MSTRKSAKAAKPAAGKARTGVLKVKGMHCKSCVNNIEEGVSSMEGVSRVSVSLKDDEATVEYDSSEVSMDEIKEEIRSLGFKVDGKGATSASPAGSGTGRKTTIAQGIGYALMPHIGCIAFIAGSILGVTLLTELFRPLLMNRWFFHILIAISIGFATLSSALYLRKQGLLSASGARKKWRYLSTMYGSTIGINLLLFLLIFPMLANVSAAQVTGAAVAGVQAAAAPAGGYSTLQMSVDIPCPGHAPLITGELKTLSGVQGVTFSFPNVFDVTYDSAKVTKADMLALDVFNEYPATVISEGKASSTAVTGAATAGTPAPIKDGVQEVTLYVQGSDYYPNPVRVKKGIPVRLTADMSRVSGCSRSIVMPDFGVSKVLSAGDNVIEFTPTQSGTFSFSCSMNMYRGTIVVEEADGTVAPFTGTAPKVAGGSCGGPGGSCGCGCGGR